MSRCWHGRAFAALGRWVAGRSPAQAQALARKLARLPWINTKRRRIAATNIALCFPQLDDAARGELLRDTLLSNTTGVLETLRNRPKDVHVVLTGRRCPPEIIELADTVTEMRMVKHAFKAGVPAQRGIED